MSKQYTVKATRQANEHLTNIYDYIYEQLEAPDSADRVITMLQEKISSLSELPNRYPLVDEEPWHSRELHKMIAESYLIYYWIDEPALKVQVTSVIFAKRSQKEQLYKRKI